MSEDFGNVGDDSPVLEEIRAWADFKTIRAVTISKLLTSLMKLFIQFRAMCSGENIIFRDNRPSAEENAFIFQSYLPRYLINRRQIPAYDFLNREIYNPRCWKT